MSNKITIQEFAQLISEKKPGLNSSEVEALLKMLFNEASIHMLNSEEAYIPGIGIFKKTSIEKGYVSFEPTNELSEAVNAPFQAFSAVELDEDYREDDFNEALNVEQYDELVVKEAEVNINDTEEDIIKENPYSDDVSKVSVDSEQSTYNESVSAEIKDECNCQDGDLQDSVVIPPPVPEVPTEIISESPVVLETPPPFNQSTAYGSDSQYVIEHDEEEYVCEEHVTSRRKFTNGLICGVVICLALAALTAVVYTLFF